jgi:hypothetical protein
MDRVSMDMSGFLDTALNEPWLSAYVILLLTRSMEQFASQSRHFIAVDKLDYKPF